MAQSLTEGSSNTLTRYFSSMSANSSPSASTCQPASEEDFSSGPDSGTESELNSMSTMSSSSSNFKSPPVKRPRHEAKKKLLFREEWKLKYLMWPLKRSGDGATEEMICVQCQEHLKAKSCTASRHIHRKHPSSLLFCGEKKRLVRQFESMYQKQKTTMKKSLELMY